MNQCENQNFDPNSFWKFLDNLKASNPKKYSEFVKSQIEEGCRKLSRPKFRFYIKLDVSSNSSCSQDFKILNIIFAEWDLVPVSNEKKYGSIPVRGSKLLPSKNLWEKIVILCFNPEVINSHLKNRDDTNQLLWLGTVYCDDELNSQTNLSEEIKFSSNPSSPKMLFENDAILESEIYEAFEIKSDSFEQQLADKINNKEPVNLQNLMKKAYESSDFLKYSNSINSDNIILPNQKPTKAKNDKSGQDKALISEINQDDMSWNVSISKNFMSLKVFLPSVNSINDFDVEISDTGVLLTVTTQTFSKPSTFNFPGKIISATAKAKFNSKTGILTIKAEMVQNI